MIGPIQFAGACVTFDQYLEIETATGTAGAFSEPPATPLRMPGSEDELLVRRVGRGDVAAFTGLVETYSPRLYRVAYRMLGNGAEAEDVVQDTFAKLWQSAPQWQAKGGGLAAWLHRVTVNRCLDRLRQFRVVTTDVLPEVIDETPGPERCLSIRRLELAVEDAVRSLPGRHRAAIVLCYFEGLSNMLAAQVLELNLKAMESLLFRARQSLRDLLEQRGVASEDLELLQ